jgi:deoxyribose-phosphate aldolase
MVEVMEKTPECRHKFIIEMGLLDSGELRRVCRLANELQPAFLKTSTGVLPPAVTADDVRRLREGLRPEVKVKAAGGIRNLEQARALIAAGADVLGTSSAMAILRELGNPPRTADG